MNEHVRRSNRKSASQIQKEELGKLEYQILNGVEDGLEPREITNKGRGVVAMRGFKRGDFVIEYAGDLISGKEAQRREKKYAEDPEIGSYMYFFTFKNKSYCIDATAESGRLGRLLNHKTSGNCHTKLVEIHNRPYLIFKASRDITVGEELEFDYGDRSKLSIEYHPWLKRRMADPRETSGNQHEEESEEEGEDGEMEECKIFVVRQIGEIYKKQNIISKTVDSLKSEKDVNQKDLMHLKLENAKVQGDLENIRKGMHKEKVIHDKEINDLKIQNGILHAELAAIKSGISTFYQHTHSRSVDPNLQSNAQETYLVVDNYATNVISGHNVNPDPDIATGNELDIFEANCTATDLLSGYEVVANSTPTPMQSSTAKTSIEKKRLYASFEELPEAVCKKLKPYNERLSMAKTDKLNPIQRAFVKHFVKCDMTPGVSVKQATDAVLDGGYAANIFNKDDDEQFDAYKSFYDYMLNRIKYEINVVKKKKRSCDELLKAVLRKQEKTENPE